MLSLQEIQSVSFEKAVFGGYDMKSVDDFVEKLIDDYSALHKENAALKAKMKVLVDKIEEYRSVEDGMRKALLSAQNIATEMLEKAKKESDEVTRTAKVQAEEKILEYATRVKQEEAKLSVAKRESQKFIEGILSQYEIAQERIKELAANSDLLKNEIKNEENAKFEQKIKQIEPEEVEKTKELGEVSSDATKLLEKNKSNEDNSVENQPSISKDFTNNKYSEECIYDKLNNESTRIDENSHIKVFEVKLGGDIPSKNHPINKKPNLDFGDLKFGKDYDLGDE